MYQVKIGPSFFQTAFRDYSHWRWAWVREILQNCQDSPGCNEVTITTELNSDNNTLVKVTNNGSPMTREILVDKFLSLGESGKRFEGSVGGFGKAKELIAFCHLSWNIKTGDIEAAGVGGDYTLNEIPYFHGTTTEVVMEGDQQFYLIYQLKAYAKRTSWKGTLTVNGEVFNTNLDSGKYRKEFSWGKVYTTDKLSNEYCVRVNGIPMFYNWIKDEGIVIELTNSTVLTSNRDSLKWDYLKEFQDFCDQVSQNRVAAFRDTKKPEKKVKFPGFMLNGRYIADIPLKQEVNLTTEKLKIALTEKIETLKNRPDNPDQKEVYLKPQFFIRSDIECNLPATYLPKTFSKNSQKLLDNWINILVELATLVKCYTEFSVGFVFSDECLALHEYSFENGHVIYINPAKFENGKLLNRWTDKQYWDLVATATHEMVHLMGCSNHDEKYANTLTDVMGLVLDNRSKF